MVSKSVNDSELRRTVISLIKNTDECSRKRRETRRHRPIDSWPFLESRTCVKMADKSSSGSVLMDVETNILRDVCVKKRMIHGRK